MRFALVVPNAKSCVPPAGGYPIGLYEHGSDGDYRSFIADRTAAALAEQCLASVGVDQPFHGIRAGNDADRIFLFINPDNPLAWSTNGRQATIDVVQEARLFTETHLRIPAVTSRTGEEISFDASKLLTIGHSQGGQNGSLFLAVGRAARGGILSGTGVMGDITLLERQGDAENPLNDPNLRRLLQAFLQLSDEDAAELNPFHPIINLAQFLFDPADPVHYMRHIAATPTGFRGQERPSYRRRSTGRYGE